MADPPTSDLDADTKKNLENRLSRCILRHQRFCRFFLVVASLRYESCFFFVAGLPKLASEQVSDEEETMGTALANASGFIWFLSEKSPYPRPPTYEYQSHQTCTIILGDALTNSGANMPTLFYL
jgi:diacylglycerol kinase family enzyme